MDKVQIYYAIMIGVSWIIHVCFDGKEIPIKAGIMHLTITSLLSLPIYGRVFGWW